MSKAVVLIVVLACSTLSSSVKNCGSRESLEKLLDTNKSEDEGAVIDWDESRKEEVIPREWPWIVALVRQDNTSHLVSGATFIHPQWTITNSFNLYDFCDDLKKIVAVFGAHKLSEEDDPDRVIYGIQAVKFHPRAKIDQFHFRLALVLLRQPVDEKFVPICLPPPGYKSYVGELLIFVGWGPTNGSDFSDPPSDVPLRSNLTVLPDNCGNNTNLTDSSTEFCAVRVVDDGDNSTYSDACGMDAGTPLMLVGDDMSYYVVGILAVGPNTCGEVGAPQSVFLDIQTFSPWIRCVLSGGSPCLS